MCVGFFWGGGGSDRLFLEQLEFLLAYMSTKHMKSAVEEFHISCSKNTPIITCKSIGNEILLKQTGCFSSFESHESQLLLSP